MDRGHKFVVLGVVSIFGAENKKLGLAGRKFNLVLGTVNTGEVQDILQLVDVIGAELGVICLAHSSNHCILKTKTPGVVL